MKRLYIGGLSPNISQKDLKDRFGKFGQVSDVEIVTRRDENGTPLKNFGYININISDADFRKCMTVLNKSKWKGGTLQIELAKESFLHRLAEERQQANEKSQTPKVVVKEEILDSFKKAGVEDFHMKSAVPGTEIPGHKDWVVSKFGRVLPVLHLKCQGKKKFFKYDPSKHCHNIKRLESADDNSVCTPVSHLTWEISGGDDEISKKRRGEFPPKKTCPKKFKMDSTCVSQENNRGHTNEKSIVENRESRLFADRKQNHDKFQKAVCVLDSDADSDGEIRKLVAQESKNTEKYHTENDDALEVVGNDFEVKPSLVWGQTKNRGDESLFVTRSSDEDEEYDSADTDELLSQNKASFANVEPHQAESKTSYSESVRHKENSLKRQNAEGHTPTFSSTSSGSEGSDEESSSSLDSDYEAMMANCYKLNFSLAELEELAKAPAENSGDENCDIGGTDSVAGTSEEAPLPKIRAPLRLPVKGGSGPQDILAALLGENSSDEECDRKKEKQKKKKKKNTTSLPAFMGTKGLFGNSAQSDCSLKTGERTHCDATDGAKRQTQVSKTTLDHSAAEDESNKLLSKPLEETSLSTPVEEGQVPPHEHCVTNTEESTKDSKSVPTTVSAGHTPVVENVDKHEQQIVCMTESETHREDSGSRDGDKGTKCKEPTVPVSPEQLTVQHITAVSEYAPKTHTPSVKGSEMGLVKTVGAVTIQTLKGTKSIHKADSASSESPTSGSSDTSDSEETENAPCITVRATGACQAGEGAKPKRVPGQPAICDVEKQKKDNQRRLAAVEQRQKEAEQQRKMIQGALSHVDTPASSKGKHIVFDSDSDGDERGVAPASPSLNPSPSAQRQSLSQEGPESSEEDHTVVRKECFKANETNQPGGVKLFDSSEEDNDDDDAMDEERFQIKPQFEGKAGQKLMALQSRFGTDERFQMDSRFLESDNEDADQEGSPPMADEQKLLEEKKKNMDILRSVLNINVQSSETSKESVKSKTFRDVSALHYDPTREEHTAFETKTEQPKKESKAARRKRRAEAEKLPEVSREVFYDVAVDLKEVFGSAKEKTDEQNVTTWDNEEKEDERTDSDTDMQLPVSLPAGEEESAGFKFSFFAGDVSKEDTLKTDEYKIETIKKAKVSWQVDPRFQDSSSEEEDEEDVQEEEGIDQAASSSTTENPAPSKKTFFFFFQDDERLKEGPKMFCRSEKLEDQREAWEERRASLIEEYRKKHKDARKKLKASQRN